MKVLDEPCSRSAVGGLVSIKFADLAHLRQMCALKDLRPLTSRRRWGHSWVFFHLQGSPCFLLLSSTKKAGLTRPSQELVKFNPLAMEKLKLEVADTIDGSCCILCCLMRGLEGKPHARYCASFTLIENSNCVLLFGGKSAGSDLSIYRELWKLCIGTQALRVCRQRATFRSPNEPTALGADHPATGSVEELVSTQSHPTSETIRPFGCVP